MPAYFEKKEAALAAKIEPSIKRQLESIAAKEDRTVSYVVGALLVRGLKLYARDGNLRDAEDLQTKEFDIGAAITSGKAPDVIINDWLVFDGCEPYTVKWAMFTAPLGRVRGVTHSRLRSEFCLTRANCIVGMSLGKSEKIVSRVGRYRRQLKQK